MKPVIIESPYAGCVSLHEAYLQACIRTCLAAGESPYASQQMLTRALNDLDPEERDLGITAGYAMRDALFKIGAEPRYFVDLDWSSGMVRAAGGTPLSGNHPLVRVIPEHEWERVLEELCQADPVANNILEGCSGSGRALAMFYKRIVCAPGN